MRNNKNIKIMIIFMIIIIIIVLIGCYIDILFKKLSIIFNYKLFKIRM